MKSMLLSKFSLTFLIVVVLVFMGVTVPLFVEENTVEATPDNVFYTPYTRYYTCPPNGWVAHSKSGTYEQGTTTIASESHYGELYWIIPPDVPGAYWVQPHIDHSVTYYYNDGVTEYISLGRYNGLCR